MRRIVTHIMVATLAIVSAASPGWGQRASDNYLPWDQAIEYESLLRKAAQDAGLQLDPELIRLFDQISTVDNQQLMPWALRVDAKSDELIRRDNAVAVQNAALITERSNLVAEKAQLEAEKVRIEGLLRTDPGLPAAITSYNQWRSGLVDRLADFDRRRNDLAAEVERLNNDFKQHADEVDNRYNPAVLAWQGDVKTLRGRQQEERKRIVEHRQANNKPLLELVPPPLRMSADKAAQFAGNTAALPLTVGRVANDRTNEHMAWAQQNPKEAGNLVIQGLAVAGVLMATGPEVAGGAVVAEAVGANVTRAGFAKIANIITAGTAVVAVEDKSIGVEERKAKQDEDRLRTMSAHVQLLHQERRRLKDLGKDDATIGKLLQAKSDALRLQVSGSSQPEGSSRFWGNVIEGTACSSVVILGVKKTTSGAVNALWRPKGTGGFVRGEN